MPKFIITWNAGYGDSAAVIEAESHAAASLVAYENWRDEAESNADYGAEEYDKDRAIYLDAEDEEDA